MNARRFALLFTAALIFVFTAAAYGAEILYDGLYDNENGAEVFYDGLLNAGDGARAIYIGDIVTLDIATDVTADELTSLFGDFEITSFARIPGGYSVSLRTFAPGEYSVYIGDKQIVVSVRSALTDIERDDIFEGGAYVLPRGFWVSRALLFIVAVSVFLISGGVVLYKKFIVQRIRPVNPRRLFMVRSGALSAYDDDYFVDMTFYFKEYLGSVYSRRIIGKTSTEIVANLSDIGQLAEMMPEIGGWLTECDRFKFTGVKPSAEEKMGHYSALVDLVKCIDDNRYRAEGGAA